MPPCVSLGVLVPLHWTCRVRVRIRVRVRVKVGVRVRFRVRVRVRDRIVRVGVVKVQG